MLSVKIGPTSKKCKWYWHFHFTSNSGLELSLVYLCLLIAFSVANSPCSLAFLCICGICDCSTEVVRSCTAVCSVEDLKNKKKASKMVQYMCIYFHGPSLFLRFYKIHLKHIMKCAAAVQHFFTVWFQYFWSKCMAYRF